MAKQDKTSWETSSKWYDLIVGIEGHYYHKEVIIPKLIKLIENYGPPNSFLDFGCGQGILSRKLPKETRRK